MNPANDTPAPAASSGPAHYIIKADMMQAVVGVLASLPYGQISNLMEPLRDVIRQQEAAHASTQPVDLKQAVAIATSLKKQRGRR